MDFTIRSEAMPSDMQVLLAQYPRNDWEAHPGFHQKTKNWLGAHRMFRQVAGEIRLEAERYLDKDRDAEAFAARLSYYGDGLVRSLHGHHHFEDHAYFPELSAADPRFDRGLEILERDHEALDAVLDHFVGVSNRTIKLVQLDEAQARSEAGLVRDTAETIQAFLSRHLTDEEELAVPIILHHRLRG